MHTENLLTDITPWQCTLVENYIVIGEDFRCSGVAFSFQTAVDALVECTHDSGEIKTKYNPDVTTMSSIEI